jgi:NADH dehydrogenase
MLSDVDRQKLLHFCIVGGGPTVSVSSNISRLSFLIVVSKGVEFAAELHDLIKTDMTRAYPHLAPMARITLYDVAPQILGTFDQELIK